MLLGQNPNTVYSVDHVDTHTHSLSLSLSLSLCCWSTENGMLASRIEILTRYQMESVKKMGQLLAHEALFSHPHAVCVHE